MYTHVKGFVLRVSAWEEKLPGTFLVISYCLQNDLRIIIR